MKRLQSYYGITDISKMLLVGLLYFGIAILGSYFAHDIKNITSFLEPAGFALAAAIIFGYRIWPGILLASIASNYFIFTHNHFADTSQIIYISIVFSFGSVFQAIIGEFLYGKFILDLNLFAKTQSIFRFAFIIIFTCSIPATICLLLFYQLVLNPYDSYSKLWFSHWIGDIASIWLLTPLILGWVAKPKEENTQKAKYTEVLIVHGLIVLIGCIVFLNLFQGVSHFKKAYITLPFMLWAAFRFNSREVVTAITFSSIIAILGTLKNFGPFTSETFDESFLSTQIYISIISITILGLFASVYENKESQAELVTANKKLTDIAEERKEQLARKEQESRNYHRRVEGIFNVLLKYSHLNFNEKAKISERADELDAISKGLNTLGDEFQLAINAELKYTEELEELNALLKEQEQRIQMIIDNAPEAVIVMDNHNIIEKWNPTATEIFGWKEEEMIGKSFTDFIIPEKFRQKYLNSIEKFSLQESEQTLSKSIEIEVLNKKGEKFYAAINVSSTLEREKIIYIAFVRDVTEIKKAEEKLYHTSYMVNSSTDAIIASDTKFNITYWNKASEKLYGYTEAEVLGKAGMEVMRSEHILPNTREHVLEQIFEQGGWVGELMQFTKDGRKIPVLSSVTKLHDKEGKMIGFLSVTRDITEIIKIQDELKASEEFLNSIVENIPNMLFIKDAKDLKFVRLNKAGEELLGYSRNDLIGKNDYDFFNKEEADFFTSKDRDVLKNKELFEIPEEQIHTKNNGIRTLETKKIPLFDKDGKPRFLLGISNDITERKAIEENLKRKTEELARSNTELEQFAYVASHDLQEPLRMVNSYVQLLAKRYGDKLDADAMEFIGFASDGSTRMRNLINSLLEYSRINRVKPFEDIDIKDLLEDVLQDLQKMITENNAVINIEEMPHIIGDHVLIHQLFLNLITNGIKFKKDRNPEITISYKKLKGEHLFSVSDNGIGIPKQYAEKIFIIFQRLHTKEKYPGTGIGLAMCKKIVERHQGKIWIDSKIDEGTTFYFTIKDVSK
jgi:PAS domain S-box-containing protein